MLIAADKITVIHSLGCLISDIFFLQVDDLTKKFIKSAEDLCKAKEKEISQGWDMAFLLFFGGGLTASFLLLIW